LSIVNLFASVPEPNDVVTIVVCGLHDTIFCQDSIVQLQRGLGDSEWTSSRLETCIANYSQAAPDGFSRPVIGINGQWPYASCPLYDIHR
jgi:hypothetical protein